MNLDNVIKTKYWNDYCDIDTSNIDKRLYYIAENLDDKKLVNRKYLAIFHKYSVNHPIQRFKRLKLLKNGPATKYRLFLLYGKEEGLKRWDIYCDKQAKTNTFEYKNKKYGMTKEEFSEFNKSRAVTEENLIRRHGEKEGIKKFKKYCEKQKDAGISLEYWIDKTGSVSKGVEKYEELNKRKALTKDNFIRKYGEKEGEKRYNTFISGLNNFYSISSQDLFSAIYKKLPKKLQEKTYYATLNKEFGKYDKETKKYYKYDFVISNIKFCIEYNGDHYHANPSIYKIGDVVEKIKGKPQRVVDIWKKDKIKNNILTKDNFCVLKVWDSDYKENPNLVVERCLIFIRRIINEIRINKKIQHSFSGKTGNCCL